MRCRRSRRRICDGYGRPPGCSSCREAARLVRSQGSPAGSPGDQRHKNALRLEARAPAGPRPRTSGSAARRPPGDPPRSRSDVNQLSTDQAEPQLRASIHVRHWSAPRSREACFLSNGALPVVTLEVEPADPAAAPLSARCRKLRGCCAPRRTRRKSFAHERTPDSAPAAHPSSTTSRSRCPRRGHAPAKVTWLAYADIQRLAPILQALASLTGKARRSRPRR